MKRQKSCEMPQKTRAVLLHCTGARDAHHSEDGACRIEHRGERRDERAERHGEHHAAQTHRQQLNEQRRVAARGHAPSELRFEQTERDRKGESMSNK